jgi:hypothetical protein
VASLVRALCVVALLAIPLVVVMELPGLLELAGSVPPSSDVTYATPNPAFRLDSTPSAARSRFASIDDTPPPTLAPPVATATAAPTPRPTATGERIIIANTGGAGAVLRSDPVTGQRVASLRDQQQLDVLERRTIPGNGDWVHVRTADGREGWVSGVVAQPVPTPSQ